MAEFAKTVWQFGIRECRSILTLLCKGAFLRTQQRSACKTMGMQTEYSVGESVSPSV